MARNEIPRNLDPLLVLARDAAGGAQTHGAAIGLAQNSADKIWADFADLMGDPDAGPQPSVGKVGEWNLAKAAKIAGTEGSHSANASARNFVATAVGVLKNYLGGQWNSQWAAAGFPNGSLRLPDDPLPLLAGLRAYFQAHPEQENAPLGVTAAGCFAQGELLSDARAAANASEVAAGEALQARDQARRVLYVRMSGLRAELDQLLTDDDPRWYAFGFRRPADGEQPGPVRNLVLTPGGPGLVIAAWDPARRAERYRVFHQIVGGEAEPVPEEKAKTDRRATLQGLPSGATVEITIVPVNEAGDGPATRGQIAVS